MPTFMFEEPAALLFPSWKSTALVEYEYRCFYFYFLKHMPNLSEIKAYFSKIYFIFLAVTWPRIEKLIQNFNKNVRNNLYTFL